MEGKYWLDFYLGKYEVFYNKVIVAGFVAVYCKT